MRVIDTVNLDTGIGLELDSWPSIAEKEQIWHDARVAGYEEFITIQPFYRAEMYGDIDYPAIQVITGAPQGCVDWALLKWK